MTEIIPRELQHPPTSWPKDWTKWHTDMKMLLNLVHAAVLDDQEKRRLERKSGDATPAEVES